MVILQEQLKRVIVQFEVICILQFKPITHIVNNHSIKVLLRVIGLNILNKLNKNCLSPFFGFIEGE